jgi:hypothetical protein
MGVGVLLRRLALANHSDGEFVFRIVFLVCVPALMFGSLSTVSIGGPLALYPPVAVAMVAAGYLAGRLAARRGPFTGTQIPVLVTASMVVNSGFALPFVQAMHGADGVARIAAFDVANTALTFSWAYYTAARGNPAHEGGSLLFNRLLRSPPLYGIAAGLTVNVSGLALPGPVTALVDVFGSATALLIPLGIGILFAPVGGELRRAAIAVASRMGSGLVVGIAVVLIFGLDGMDRSIMLLIAVAPAAFVTVTFASLENLDVRLATTTLSLSLATSFVLSLVVALLTG